MSSAKKIQGKYETADILFKGLSRLMGHSRKLYSNGSPVPDLEGTLIMVISPEPSLSI